MVCRYCGQNNPENARFCSRCGMNLTISQMNSSQQSFGEATGNHSLQNMSSWDSNEINYSTVTSKTKKKKRIIITLMALFVAIGSAVIVGIFIIPSVLSNTKIQDTETQLVCIARYKTVSNGEQYVETKYTYNKDGSKESYTRHYLDGTAYYECQYLYEDGFCIGKSVYNAESSIDVYEEQYKNVFDADGHLIKQEVYRKQEVYENQEKRSWIYMYEHGDRQGTAIVSNYLANGSDEEDWLASYRILEDGRTMGFIYTPADNSTEWGKLDYQYDENGLEIESVSYTIIADSLEDAMRKDVNDAIDDPIERTVYEHNWIEEGKRAEVTVIVDGEVDEVYIEEYKKVPIYIGY